MLSESFSLPNFPRTREDVSKLDVALDLFIEYLYELHRIEKSPKQSQTKANVPNGIDNLENEELTAP
ncbi:hypothetical protein [Candidatus Leptofilum sp.]|uniref:hypothetical protein n=1 Tax=Candidatus Leptofilum sp. TaxID=3241576 RepID=UPI003B5C12EC